MIGWLLAANAVVNGMNSLNQSNSEIAQWEGRERGQRFNAAVRRSQAQATSASADLREEQQRRGARLALGSTAAMLGQSGTGTGGSNADVQAQNQLFAEMDALNIRYEGQLQRHNLLLEAQGEDAAADVSHDQASRASKAKGWGFFGALLGAGAKGYGYGGGGSSSITSSGGGGLPEEG